MSQNLETSRRPSVVEAQGAVRAFLSASLPDVRRVDITRIAPLNVGEITWEAEADVWQPNPRLAALQIETSRPVLDQSRYLVQLDALLNVLAYELEGSADKRTL
jgi:hypothetical protein